MILTIFSSPSLRRNAQCQEAMASTRIAGNVDLAPMLLRYELKHQLTSLLRRMLKNDKVLMSLFCKPLFLPVGLPDCVAQLCYEVDSAITARCGLLLQLRGAWTFWRRKTDDAMGNYEKLSHFSLIVATCSNSSVQCLFCFLLGLQHDKTDLCSRWIGFQYDFSWRTRRSTWKYKRCTWSLIIVIPTAPYIFVNTGPLQW